MSDSSRSDRKSSFLKKAFSKKKSSSGDEAASPAGASGDADAPPSAEPDGGAALAAISETAAEPIDISANEGGVAGAAPPPAAPGTSNIMPPEFESEGGKPKCGFTTEGVPGLEVMDGDGTSFSLRIGPDYKKHGKKAPSAPHTYAPMTIDVFKRKKSAAFHVASKLTLPPPPDGAAPNPSGLPRRIVVNAIIPMEAPPLLGGGTDGACYQVVMVFGATGESLKAWEDAASPAVQLFARWARDIPEGVLPSQGDLELKERLKLLPKLENMASLGLPGWIQGYNGKPALLTKSGAMFRGDDYLEIDFNTFRFGFLTKKGIHYLTPRFVEYDFHAALTVEGRADAELPEQTLLACRLRGLDLVKLAKDGDLFD